MNKQIINTLFKRIQEGNFTEVKFLVKKGADVNEPMQMGKTPLMVAAENGYLDIATYLIENGADIHAADHMRKVGALMLACEFNHPQLVELLIKLGANVNL